MAVDVEDLRAWGTCSGSRGYRLTHEAADEIERLRELCDKQADMIRTVDPLYR